MLYTRRRHRGIPAATAVVLTTDTGHSLLVRCPYCQAQHIHQGGPYEPGYGLRRALCRLGAAYWTVPG
ncbi:hypothetical protein EF910_32095 [Streptomyces sp. WAC07149]|nr:hypothetical protein EF910_32095 [Streptomyces sp. WAC07149]